MQMPGWMKLFINKKAPKWVFLPVDAAYRELVSTENSLMNRKIQGIYPDFYAHFSNVQNIWHKINNLYATNSCA